MRISPIYILFLFLVVSCFSTKKLPDYSYYPENLPEKQTITDDFYRIGNNNLHKNQAGFWELYLEGNPVERGIANGTLSQELIYKQEKIFVSKIEELVPSRFNQKLIRSFLKFYNRKLPDYIPDEYKAEIFGMSKFTSHDFDFVAPVYWRTLYFHAAHDIGHALQDLAMVGCTSFAAWGERSEGGKLILGRNFDFYINDEFSNEKMIAFINPDNGNKHAFVTWPGMIGAVSGMNEKGLTVTINAGKSAIPLKAKTPISLLTREILQFASNFEEAIQIAKSREVFVSESIMVGSAQDKSAILIEVSPKKMGVFRVENGTDFLVCSNHFQSEAYETDKRNKRTIEESHSNYRFERMNELITENPPMDPKIAVEFLRNKDGLNDLKLGLGNEKAINQLIAHHAVLFQPEDLLMWVSTKPYQMGSFVAYDLNEVFGKMEDSTQIEIRTVDSLQIPEDKFIQSIEFQNYKEFKKKLSQFKLLTTQKQEIVLEDLQNFVLLNQDYWLTYFVVAEYYYKQKNYKLALENYRVSLTKEITTLPDKELIEKQISKCERKLK